MSSTKIPVVYYHSVGPRNKAWVRNHLTLELPYFEHQVKKISQNYTAITLKEFWEARNGMRKAPHNAIVITFDDGFLDNWVWAFPYLKKYNLKATIFVNPEFVDTNANIRNIANLDQPTEQQINKLENRGYMSWDEMREIEKSGLIDIQSHTMTHTKYFISDKLIGFNRPQADILYPIGNEFVKEKPFYLANTSFEKLLPYGYPLFEESSAVIAKRVWINQSFNKEVIQMLKDFNWNSDPSGQLAFEKVKPIYEKYKKRDDLIIKKESKEEYEQRVVQEIIESKRIIEEKLNKKVEFLCWPHGDNNFFAHETAIKAGYLATTLGKYQGDFSYKDRIDSRIGTDSLKENVFLTTSRMFFNINVYKQKFPYYHFKQLYYSLKN